jgi:hypothetical protein
MDHEKYVGKPQPRRDGHDKVRGKAALPWRQVFASYASRSACGKPARPCPD